MQASLWEIVDWISLFKYLEHLCFCFTLAVAQEPHSKSWERCTIAGIKEIAKRRWVLIWENDGGEISRFLQEIEKISQNSKLSTCIWFHPSWWWIKSNCEMTSIWRTSGGRVFIYLNLFQPFVILLLSIFTFLFWDGLVVLCSCRVSLAFGSPLLCIPASCFAFNWICIEETIDVSPGNHFLLILNLLNEGTWGVQWFLSLLFYLMDELKNVIEGW